MSGRLANKVALVFGAGSTNEFLSNGRATAIAYAREGAWVFAVDKNMAAAQQTVADICRSSQRARALVADVTSADQVRQAVQMCVEQAGRIDILHNNVGCASPGGPVEMDEACWDHSIDLNLKSVYLTCKHVLPIMEAQGGGVIINVSSIAGSRWLGTPYISYAAAKSGLDQFTIAIALQYANKGIRANVVSPGLIDSARSRDSMRRAGKDFEATVAERHAMCPTGRMGDPWDVAYASLFLASDEAKYINGVVLPVDGGMSSQCVSPRR